jgi:2-oxoglutarate ferredoxin oxidoreductase subunit beta
VIFDHPRPTFDRAVTDQNAKLSEGKRADMQALLSRGQTWTVEKSNTVFD